MNGHRGLSQLPRGRWGVGWGVVELSLAAAVVIVLACVLLRAATLVERWMDAPSADEQLAVAIVTRDDFAVDAALAAGASHSAADAVGRTPLMTAALVGHATSVDRLLDLGADVNVVDALGRTPLMYAACFDRHDIAQRLIDRGADPHARDRGGKTALDLAILFGSERVASLLRAVPPPPRQPAVSEPAPRSS